MKDSKNKSGLFELIIIIIAIISIINTYIVGSNKIAIYENPNNSISDCRGLAYHGPNAEKDKEKCLESIKSKEEKAIQAEEYMKNNKGTHTIISLVLLLATTISLVITIRKRKNIGYILLGIITIIINIFSLL